MLAKFLAPLEGTSIIMAPLKISKPPKDLKHYRAGWGSGTGNSQFEASRGCLGRTIPGLKCMVVLIVLIDQTNDFS